MDRKTRRRKKRIHGGARRGGNSKGRGRREEKRGVRIRQLTNPDLPRPGTYSKYALSRALMALVI